MVSDSVPIETAHEDMIHDAQLDYYGKRLATCSSDRTVKVFDVVEGETRSSPGHTLKGHTGPVWQVAWAHPKYGHILASSSYDGKVLIWKEQQAQGNTPGGWIKIKEHTLHTASVNSVSWAPHELGAILACASSDGKVSVLTFKNDGQWDADIFTGHAIGCNAVSWAPAVLPGSLITPQQAPGPGQTPNTSQTFSVKRLALGEDCAGSLPGSKRKPWKATLTGSATSRGHRISASPAAISPLPRRIKAS
jgi:protein transport protein SEC13